MIIKMTDKIKIPTFLKWAGGKRRILKDLDRLFPEKIDRYFEPFLGAGSVFFFVKKKYNPKFCAISDINKDLVDTYISVRDKPRGLIKNLKFFDKNNSEEFYYTIREKFNEKKINGIKRSAAFIYLNKTCYNGLYRVNSKNEFNVPYGRYKHPEIFNTENILEASGLLQGVQITTQDYRNITNQVKSGDFIYLDPCYDPLKKTSFANYTPKKFCEADRINLASFIKYLKNSDVNLVLSNNDLSEIRRIYSEFKIAEIQVSRAINSNSKERGKIMELVIRN